MESIVLSPLDNFIIILFNTAVKPLELHVQDVSFSPEEALKFFG